MNAVVAYAVFHLSFVSDHQYANPLWDVQLTIHLQSPSGREVIYDGYWDGQRDFKATLSLDEPGPWTWQSQSSDASNAGFKQQGTIHCQAYTGNHPLYAHGLLRVSNDGTHLEHADGTPFFWLADTAWNGVIRGDDNDWKHYLQLRSQQQFTVIQCVLPHWRGDAVDEFGFAACTEEHPIRVNPEYFQEKDRRFAMINEYGMLAAPVALWSLLETDLGFKLPVEDAIVMARYVVARYGAYQLVWLLGGDGDYLKMGAERWKQIASAVFEQKHDRLITLHPCGQSWPNEMFRHESWFDLIGYQSGHGDADDQLQWLVNGPVTGYLNAKPRKPVINLEPNYEGAFGYQQQTVFDDRQVRRACYWSCLLSPTAGVTYGHDSIWNWNKVAGPSEGHGNWGRGAVAPWHTGLQTPGISSMTILRQFFKAIDWHHLLPAPHLLKHQPGSEDPRTFIAVAQTADSRCIVAYTPVGCMLDLDTTGFKAQWFDPRKGTWSDATTTTTPDDQDWLLVLRK